MIPTDSQRSHKPRGHSKTTCSVILMGGIESSFIGEMLHLSWVSQER